MSDLIQTKPLVDKDYLLKRFPGKGGWTFIEIPEILPDKHAHFGWVKVRGYIDDYELIHYPLQPMGNGKLFLPVKAEIRKKIKKQAGDIARVILYKNEIPLTVPEELLVCLQEVPHVYEKFLQLSEGKQKTYMDWIFSAKKDETKIQRIIATIDEISQLKK